jgi:hypothetical protein
MLEAQSPATANIAGIGEIFSGPGIGQMFNLPGLPPTGDPRTPDIVVTPNIGVTYSGSGKKLAEYGGSSHDGIAGHSGELRRRSLSCIDEAGSTRRSPPPRRSHRGRPVALFISCTSIASGQYCRHTRTAFNP